MSSFATDVLDGVYEALGEPARFIPKIGSEADCLVHPDQGDAAYDFSGLDVTAERTVYQLRRSEIAVVKQGDQFRYPREDGRLYKVNARPRLLDTAKAEWTLELVEAEE